MSILEKIKEGVIVGNEQNIKEYTDRAVADGLAVASILNDGLIAGMNAVGALFKNNEVYIPEVLMAARAMHTGLAIIKPLIVSAGIKEKGVVAIGTVKGDMHDIGKNLVIMMLEGAGYKVIDLGVDVPVEQFLRVVEEHHPQVIGISALLTTTMPQMRVTVEKLKECGDRIKIVVGGAPITSKFAEDICADGFAADGASAVELVAALIEGK
jgi:5-methyltetrahydrofolate--homocysteine methyltransferase